MTNQSIKPNLTPTMMGMVPYREAAHCAEVILASCPEAVRLPIMTGSFRWALEGIPLLSFNSQKKCVIMLPPEENEEKLLEFYDRIEQDDLDYFPNPACRPVPGIGRGPWR